MSQKRLDSLPVLYANGSHFDIGYNIGRTFCGLIKTLVETYPPLINEYLALYETPEGKDIYDKAYECVSKHFPFYVRELQGMSNGAKIPFYKIFLLHLEEVLSVRRKKKQIGCHGCSTVCLNLPTDQILGHAIETHKEVLNNLYILKAHITEPQVEQRFTALAYAGLLPGYGMGFNKHGLVYSVNMIAAKYSGRGHLPRSFVLRHLLTADSYETVLKILRCNGCGIVDPMSINFTFLNRKKHRMFQNIEVSHMYPVSTESVISVLTLNSGEIYFHGNKFLHLNGPQGDAEEVESSETRQRTFEGHYLFDKESVKDLLGDTSHKKYNFFRSSGPVATVVVGIFDCLAKTWTLYLDNPKTSDPIAVLSLNY